MSKFENAKKTAEAKLSEVSASLKENAPKEMIAIARDDFAGVDVLKRGIGGKIAWGLGLDPWGKAIKSVGTAIGFGGRAGVVSRIAKGAFGRDKMVPLPTESDDPAVRFRVAQEMYGRTDADVESLRRACHRMFVVYFMATVLSLCYGILMLPSALASGLPTPLAVFFPFFLVPMLLARAARSSFRHWQLKERRLGGLGEWWRSRELMPSSSALCLLLLFGFAAATLVPSTAAAVDLFDFTANGDDFFKSMLSVMLSGVGPIADKNSPYSAPLAAAFAVFNSSLLSLAAAMLAWHTISGAVSTAKDGKLLGERWHEIWAPVRVGTGITMLAPMSTGYCAAQLVVLYILTIGSNLATNVWGGYMDALSGGASNSASSTTTSSKFTNPIDLMGPMIRVQASDMARAFGEKEVCWQTIVDHLSKTGSANVGVHFWTNGSPAIDPKKWPTAEKSLLGNYVWDFGPVCGKLGLSYASTMEDGAKDAFSLTDLNLTSKQQQITGIKAQFGNLTNDGLISAKRQEFLDKIVGDIDAARIKMVPFAQQWIALTPGAGSASGATAISATTLDQSVKAMIQTYVDAWKNRRQDFDDFASTIGGALAGDATTTAKKHGWASAGAYYMTIARLQGQMMAMLGFTPSELAPMNVTSLGSTELQTKLQGDGKKIPGAVTSFKAYWAYGQLQQWDTLAGTTEAGTDQGMEAMTNGIVMGLLRKVLDMERIDAMNAMPDMISHGHGMIVAAYGSMAVRAALNAKIELAASVASTADKTATLLGWIPGIGQAAMAGTTMATVVAQTLAFLFMLWGIINMLMLGCGAMLAYVLPLSNYFLFTMAVVSMLILAVEAVVAAPIFAFHHVRLDGAEFADSIQKPGYQIMLNSLLLRPSLIMFGMFLSYGVYGASVWLVQATYYPAVSSMVSGHYAGIIGVFIFIAAFGYMHWQLAMKAFALINQVPDRVLRWTGQSGDGLHDENDGHSATRVFVGGVQNQLGAVQGAMGGLASSMGAAAGRMGKAPTTNKTTPTRGGDSPN